MTPLKPGDGWCVAAFIGGLYEFLVHPDEAAWCLEHGIRLNGVPLTQIHVVDEYPGLNGVLIRAQHPFEEIDAFIDASQTERQRALPLHAVA